MIPQENNPPSLKTDVVKAGRSVVLYRLESEGRRPLGVFSLSNGTVILEVLETNATETLFDDLRGVGSNKLRRTVTPAEGKLFLDALLEIKSTYYSYESVPPDFKPTFIERTEKIKLTSGMPGYLDPKEND